MQHGKEKTNVDLFKVNVRLLETTFFRLCYIERSSLFLSTVTVDINTFPLSIGVLFSANINRREKKEKIFVEAWTKVCETASRQAISQTLMQTWFGEY